MPRLYPVSYDAVNQKLFVETGIDKLLFPMELTSHAHGSSGSSLPGVVQVTNASRDFAPDDQGKTILWSSDNAQYSITLKTEATLGATFSPGSKTTIVQTGERQIRVETDSGVTLTSDQGWASYADTYFSTGIYSSIDLIYLGNDSWVVIGDVTTYTNPSWDITAVTGAYVFSGSPGSDLGDIGLSGDQNPSLTIKRGKEMIFRMNASGHPLWIKETQGTGQPLNQTHAAHIYNPGSAVGTQHIRFNQTGTFYYQCEYHSAMNGTITVY